MTKVAIVSLGCAKNTVDSECLAGALKQQGWDLTSVIEDAKIVIVNTCGFIEEAREESVETILTLALCSDGNPSPHIIAVGCLAERYGEDLLNEMPELSAVIGPGYWDRMPEVLEQALKGQRTLLVGAPPLLAPPTQERCVSTPRSYAYLKISDGCDNHCGYCAIPLIRGALRSKPITDILVEARLLIEQGFSELVVIAQDSTAYGHDLGLPHALPILIKKLDALPGDHAIRLMYAHPAHLTQEVIELFGTCKKLLPYLDLPIQHAHPEVLRAMGRTYTDEDVASILARLRSVRPEIVIRTTVLLGYPGETEIQVKYLQKFLQNSGIRHLGAFAYSEEQGTRAVGLKRKVSQASAEKRKAAVMAAHQKRSRSWLRGFVGELLPVVIDGISSQSEHLLEGRTSWQAPEVDGVVLITSGNAVPGQRVLVRITDALDYDLVGEIEATGPQMP